MGTGVFWGIILILIGLALVIKVVFRVDFPVFKVILAFIFIYLGVRMLMGSFGIGWFNHSHEERNAMFGEKYVCDFDEGQNQFNAIFGKTTIDLRDTALLDKNARMEVNVVFGGAEILLNKEIPYKIKFDVAFGGAQLPDGDNAGGFGSNVFTTPNFTENQPYVYIKASIVFGGMEIKYR